MSQVGKRTDERVEPSRPDTSSRSSSAAIGHQLTNARNDIGSQLQPATAGSLGLDVATTVAVTLLDQKPQRIPSNAKGPVTINKQACGALLLGRSSTSLKGLTVIPGRIDADYTGTIDIIVQTSFPPIHIPAGSRIAQLVPLPHLTADIPPKNVTPREDRGFGSTGAGVFLTMSMNRRPATVATLEARGQQIQLSLLLDTGADLTIVEERLWPKTWPTKPMERGVEGVGGYTPVQRSVDRIVITIDNRHATVPVTIMPLPNGVNGLIGRDVLDQLGVVLTTERVFQ